ncbi:MAG TPA: hypothetical protein VFG86_24410, partial [Chloroflexota bacterium]|nr:hypothetical protein [Chloroflexota bacterium]
TAVAPAASPTPVFENRYRVELRNARDGRGPDYDGTFNQVQALFRQGNALLSPPLPVAAAAPVPARPTPAPGATAVPLPTPLPLPVVTPVALSSEELAQLTEQRRVTVRLAPRRPRVLDLDLAPAEQQANLLIGEPVLLRWQNLSWTVSRDELANMLRYQTGRDGKLSAYLSRDGLIAKATQIAREAERSLLAPRSSQSEVLPLDVPNTAAVIWQLASNVDSGRAGEIVWTEEEPTTTVPDAPLPAAP